MSVIVPAYNAVTFIGAALGSLRRQTLARWEAIVIDDCSTDDTAALVEGLARSDQRIRLVRMASNAGPAAARNRGLAEARGEWIAVLDSDDRMVADRLERLARRAEDVGADLIADDLIAFHDKEPASAAPFFATGEGGWLSAERYLEQSRLFSGSSDYGYLKPLFRASSLRARNLTYDERLRIAEDDDLVVRALLGGARYWLERDPGYLYRRHGASTSHRLSTAQAAMMVTVSAEHVRAHPMPPLGPLLRKRHSALERGLAFARIVDALKARKPAKAALAALRCPTSLPLLRMPLAAAFRRRFPDRRPVDRHPAAERLVHEQLAT